MHTDLKIAKFWLEIISEFCISLIQKFIILGMHLTLTHYYTVIIHIAFMCLQSKTCVEI